MHQKNVVYKISCKQCEVSYVGQTKRTLASRVKEHSRSVDEAKTSLFVDRKGKNDTGLPAHCLDTAVFHRFDFDNAEVLCRETHLGNRLKKEAMYIVMVENTCNIQKGRDLMNPTFGYVCCGTFHSWFFRSGDGDCVVVVFFVRP